METETTIETQWDKREGEGIESAVKAVVEAKIAANEEVEGAEPAMPLTVTSKRRGPKRGVGATKAFVVLPVTFAPQLADKLDKVWADLGLDSRMQLFRESLSAYLKSVGEDQLASEILASGKGKGGRKPATSTPESVAA